MAISSLVTGSVFQRPAISFSNKQTEYKLEKISYLLNNKSTMGDLAVSISNLNSQLKQTQKISKDVIKSIISALNTITKAETEMTIRFRRLIKEISDSRTEFTKGLAGIVPSIRGGEGLAVNPIALGPVATAAATPTNKPSSGDAKWDAFIAFVEVTSPILFRKLGTKLVTMAGLATVPVAGWVVAAVTFVTVVADAVELYKLWCQFSNQKPEQTAIDAAIAAQNKQQVLQGAPQGVARTDMSMAGETGAFAEAASKAKGAPQQTPRSAANIDATSAPSTTSSPKMPTDMSLSGETGAFDAARQAGAAPTPQRKPTETTPPQSQRRPAEATAKQSAPVAPKTGAPVDPHVKSRAMFQQVLDMEARGDSGATAMYFAADKQRMAELASIKQTAAAPGAPKSVKKEKAIPLPPKRPNDLAGGEEAVDARAANAQYAPLAGGEEAVNAGVANAQMNREKIQGPMESMIEKKERAEAAGRYDIDDDSISRATEERAKLESDLAKREAIASGEKTPAQVRGTLRQAGEQIKPNAADLAQGTPAGTPTPPATTNKIKPEFEPGYGGKAGQILMQNINDYNATQTSTGGEGNNIAGTNMPLTVNNPSLQEFLDRQHIIFQ